MDELKHWPAAEPPTGFADHVIAARRRPVVRRLLAIGASVAAGLLLASFLPARSFAATIEAASELAHAYALSQVAEGMAEEHHQAFRQDLRNQLTPVLDSLRTAINARNKLEARAWANHVTYLSAQALTSTTINAAATPGISLIIRTALPDNGR